jgi:dTDP-glucose pyrophosphorylase
MEDWRRLLLHSSHLVKDAISVIDKYEEKIAIIITEEGRLLGTVTDGDIRRGLLKGVGIDCKVEQIMQIHPTIGSIYDDSTNLLEALDAKKISIIPLVDAEGYIVDVKQRNELAKKIRHDNPVVIMAGGLATRLRPLTENIPKSMLKIAGKPLLEITLQQLSMFGFKDIYISVNYLADNIENYFNDGRSFNLNIQYLRESTRMGTAGSLNLLPKSFDLPILVMNGDLLTKVNYTSLLDFHKSNIAKMTVSVRDYETQVPYGVVGLNGLNVVTIKEKPLHSYFVNAGLYVIEPEILSLLPEKTYMDMPSLIETLIVQEKKVIAFPIREYWVDIGKHEDLVRADKEFIEYF